MSYSSIELIINEQNEIIEKAEEIELFLIKNKNKDKSYKMLKILFSLFKTELETNLTLRETLIKIRSNKKIYEEIHQKIEYFFKSMELINPKYNNFEIILKKLNKLKDKNNDLENLKILINNLKIENDILINKKSNLELIYKELIDKTNLEINSQENILNQLILKENDLKIQLKNLLNNNEELENNLLIEKNYNSISKLKESINDIDLKINELKEKMNFLENSHKEKIKILKNQIKELKLQINDMNETKIEIENALDITNQSIEQYTNPLYIKEDPNFNIFSGKYHLTLLKENINEKEEELKKSKIKNELLFNDIIKLKNDLLIKETRNSQINENLNELIEKNKEMENFLIELTDQREILDIKQDELKILDQNKRNLIKENKIIHQKFEEFKNKFNNEMEKNKILKINIKNLNSQLINIKNSLNNDKIDPLIPEIINFFNILKKKLNLSENSSPSEIVDLILDML